MNRWLALLLAITGGAAGAYGALRLIADGLASTKWVRTFVSEPWPAWTDPLVGGGIILTGLLLWALVGWVIWSLLRGHPGPPEAG